MNAAPIVSWLPTALAAFAALLALCALVWVAVLARRLARRCRHLEGELAVVQRGAMGMGQRILALEKSGGRAGSCAPAPADLAGPSYSQASYLLSQGLDAEEVARRCGLSRAETTLLDALRHNSSDKPRDSDAS